MAVTTTTVPVFQPREPTGDEVFSYVFVADIGLANTPWNPATMGTNAFGVMLREGALAACRSLHAHETLPQAMYAALQTTPLAGQDPADYEPLAQMLMLVLVNPGVRLYCPSLDPGVDDPSFLTNSWRELIGAEVVDPESIIEDGTWIVGIEVRPGTYRNSGSSEGCYWERLSGFGGGPDDRIANGYSTDQQIVTIEPTDAGFMSEGCGYWFLVEDS